MMKYHIHNYRVDCEIAGGHKHTVSGYCESMIGVRALHFHVFYGVSSYADHTHYFSGMTGMPIKTENGHIHKMEGSLEFSREHAHDFKGHTFEEISYISGKALGRAYV